MNNKNKIEEKFSRREFFKSAVKKVLPIIAIVALAGTPILSKAGTSVSGCNNGCTSTCEGTCKGTCKTGCHTTCYDGCYTTCKDTCKGACRKVTKH